ncbi:PilW family protein [Kistimonas scapharcae]|uniref:PilW family protein n=2 Tax=Kistimonas scapharcae TaxID=1036133 RepID=A0ABP8V7I6_9GAMM
MDDKTFKTSNEYCAMALSRQRGSSLVEVMVSLLLGAIMLLGAVQILVNSKRDFLIRDAMSSVEEAGNYTFDLIGGDLRVAGYKGCVSKRDTTFDNLITSSGAVFQPERGIQGWEASGTAYSDTLTPAAWGSLSAQSSANWTTTTGAQANNMPATSSTAARGSDIIRIWGIEPYVFNITSATATSLTVDGASTIGFPEAGGTADANDRILIVSDCEKTLIVKATDFNRTSGVITLGGNSGGTSQLTSMRNMEAVIIRGVQYYIGKRGDDANNHPSLYRKRIKADGTLADAEELVEGIANMQIVYGETTGTTSQIAASRYVTADQVTDWRRVVSVRMWLLVETTNDFIVSKTGEDYSYISQTYTPPDRRFRREMSMTINLRNRTLGAMPWM